MIDFINRHGNEHDVFCSLDCNFKLYTIEDLNASIEDEKQNRNRLSHIKHLARAIRLKEKGATSFRREKKR